MAVAAGFLPLIALFGSVLALIFRFIIHPCFFSPLSKIPAGHWTAHFSPLWILYIRWSQQENATILQLHAKYGEILRLGPNELSVNSYKEGLKKIYLGGFPKNNFYKNRFTNYETTNMFSMTNGKEHSDRKRMLSHVYSKSYVLTSPTTKETTKALLYDRLLPILEESSRENKPLELLELMSGYSMDGFMTYQFGLTLGTNFTQNAEERKWYLHQFFKRRPYLFFITDTPRIVEFFARFGIRIVPKWVDEATNDLESWQLKICDKAESMLSSDEKIQDANYPVIYAQERLALRKAYPKMSVLNTPRKSTQTYPFRYEIASDMYDHNAAAHETSGDTLTYVHYELALRPALQQSLREELMTLDPPLLYPVEAGSEIVLPDFKAVDGLPLLDAILMETLRLWVAVPGRQPRVTPETGCTIAGYDIPPGVVIQCYAYALHRNPEVFPEPEVWKPERWLKSSPEHLAEMRRWFWAFGSGGRMCIGNNIAIHCEYKPFSWSEMY
ncbi:hypothetical protein CLCR_08447 [Cladophialophora carrionii]|uniref:Cytochrome P450 n=1 Tax=Cladophialophora carrionii TaxID=86049 RepID=A0A1C1CV17_9EURO|nr:hypothetical protein CLCR_08447 [Cladophialophora carrionii]